jgi:hypothetical protein
MRPQLHGDKIITSWTADNVTFIQELSLVNGSSSGLPDTLNILYRCINRSGRLVNIATRLVLDPVLNGSEPRVFCIPDNVFLSNETVFSSGSIPFYWYAFDNYDKPTVKVQGTIDGSTAPSKIIFASWERFNENNWEFPVNSSREFRREGTGFFDGSVALYYGPVALKMNQTNEITARYGLYQGKPLQEQGMTLGLSVTNQSASLPVTVTADFLNSLNTQLDRLKIEIFVPTNFMLAGGETNIFEFTNIATNDSREVSWDLEGPGNPGDNYVKVKALGYINETRTVETAEAEKMFTFLPLSSATNLNVTAYNIVTNVYVVSNNPAVSLTNIVTNNVTPAVTAVKPSLISPAISKKEMLLLGEISDLDKLIESVDLKYQILDGIYKNEYTTNSAFLNDLDHDIEQFEEKLSGEEERLTNELMILRD